MSAAAKAPIIYPAEYEQWWLQAACRELGQPDPKRCLAQLEAVVARLSDAFTTGRQGARTAAYGQSRMEWLAYGLYFAPQTYTRVRMILQEVAARVPGWLAHGGPIAGLDLGVGTGAAALAVWDHWNRERPLRVLGLDAAPAALELFQELAQEARRTYPTLTVQTRRADIRQALLQEEGLCDLITASYALNEAYGLDESEALRRWLGRALRHLREDGFLLICEPLVLEDAARMQLLRTWAVTDFGMHVWAPCPHQAACPLRTSHHGPCHDVRAWKPPPAARFLNRHLHRGMHELKFSFLLLGKSPPPAAAWARIIGPVAHHKGRSVFPVCAGDGTRREFELLHRHLAAPEKHFLHRLDRGAVITYADAQPLNDGATTRIRLTSAPGEP